MSLHFRGISVDSFNALSSVTGLNETTGDSSMLIDNMLKDNGIQEKINAAKTSISNMNAVLNSQEMADAELMMKQLAPPGCITEFGTPDPATAKKAGIEPTASAYGSFGGNDGGMAERLAQIPAGIICDDMFKRFWTADRGNQPNFKNYLALAKEGPGTDNPAEARQWLLSVGMALPDNMWIPRNVCQSLRGESAGNSFDKTTGQAWLNGEHVHWVNLYHFAYFYRLGKVMSNDQVDHYTKIGNEWFNGAKYWWKITTSQELIFLYQYYVGERAYIEYLLSDYAKKRNDSSYFNHLPGDWDEAAKIIAGK